MTNREAIKWLILQRNVGVKFDDEDNPETEPLRIEARRRIVEAYDLAIDALKSGEEGDRMKTAKLKVLPVSVLKPEVYNPRKRLKPGDKEYEKIKNFIEEFGFSDPLVVNADMTIIGGHKRLSVAKDLGYTQVLCAVVDVDKVREKVLNIALDKIAGAWDDNLLADLLEDL